MWKIWMARRPDQTPLLVLGGVLIASGLFHAAVWAIDGGSLSGPVSWRKPIVFGLSGGILSVSLAWLTGYLRPTRASVPMAWAYVAFMGTEVFLITLQQWRGVASHFNSATALDSAIFQIMGALIVAVAVQIGWWTWRSFRALDAPRDLAHAIRAGLLFTSVGNLLGIAIVANAQALAAGGATENLNILGAAGMMKVPHGVALHALQVLPVLAWMLRRAGVDLPTRLRRVRLATAGYAGVLAFTMAQTFAGRAPHDVSPATVILGAAAVIALAIPFLSTLASARAPQRAATARTS